MEGLYEKKLLIGLLSACFVATSSFSFISCDNNQGNQKEVDHNFGEWSCFEKGESCADNIFLRVCSTCREVEWRMGTEEDHIWNTEYSYNKTYHWIECASCGMVKDFEAHTADNMGICTECGEKKSQWSGFY